MQIKAKFKPTEVGLVPEDWDIKTLGDLTLLLTNGFVGKATDFYVNSDDSVLYIQGYNVEPNSFNFNGIKRVSKEFHTRHQRSCLRAGDLLTIQTGDIGVTTEVPPELAGSNCHALVISRLDKQRAYPGYYCYFFNSARGRTMFKEIETGTTMKHLNIGDMAKLVMPVPPLPEQRAIATALSDVDGLINSLDRLIKKKRDIKQASTQRLLTGQTRLPGFKKKEGFTQTEAGLIPEDWTTCSLEDACVHGGLVRGPFGGHLRKEFFVNSGFKVYEQKNAIYRDCELGSYFVSQEKFNELKRFSVLPGDFILSCSGTIGRIYRVPLRARPGIINQALLKIRINLSTVAPDYFYHVFSWDKFQLKIVDNTQGGAMQNLVGMSVFRKTTLAMPSLAEQLAIAEVISDIEAEISTLEQRRHKTLLLKQGMMQDLLTGRIRLI